MFNNMRSEMKHLSNFARHEVAATITRSTGSPRAMAASVEGPAPTGLPAGEAQDRIRPKSGDALPTSKRYLRLPELQKIVPWSAATIWRHSKDPASKFPKSIKLSPRVTVWSAAAVEAFLAEKEAA